MWVEIIIDSPFWFLDRRKGLESIGKAPSAAPQPRSVCVFVCGMVGVTTGIVTEDSLGLS